jgi:hypothetical protein
MMPRPSLSTEVIGRLYTWPLIFCETTIACLQTQFSSQLILHGRETKPLFGGLVADSLRHTLTTTTPVPHLSREAKTQQQDFRC